MYFLNGFANGLIAGGTCCMIITGREGEEATVNEQVAQQTGYCFGLVVGFLIFMIGFICLFRSL